MQTYAERAKLCTHPLTKKIFQLAEQKQSNLCVSADVTRKKELLQLADALGPSICVLKTHIDILEDFDQDTLTQLQHCAHKHNFIIFEDRKFADIGNTVSLQYSKGIYHIADWATITNAHSVPGAGVIDGLKKIGLAKNNGLLLIAEMSSVGNLCGEDYTQKTLRLALEHPDFVIGFIAQHGFVGYEKFITFTPGVQLEKTGDSLGQQYITPFEAIAKRETDIIIVGRGILKAEDSAAEAKRYKREGWEAYLHKTHLTRAAWI